jgi:hypothetical protein
MDTQTLSRLGLDPVLTTSKFAEYHGVCGGFTRVWSAYGAEMASSAHARGGGSGFDGREA